MFLKEEQEEYDMHVSKKKVAGITLLVLALLATIGGAYALYTGTATQKQNTFSISAGKSDDTDAGEILEPNWVAANAADLQPNMQHIAKDPSLKSKVEYEAWVFMRLEIPVLTGRKSGDTTDQIYEAVAIDDLNTTDWELIKSTPSTTAGTNSVYIYGYKTPLAAKVESSKLFTSFSIPNFTQVNESSTGSGKYTDSIDVSASMISTDGTLTLTTAAQQLGILP